MICSISTTNNPNKDSNFWKTVTYERTDIGVNELIEKIREGYAFSGVYNSDIVTPKNRRKDNFLYTSIIPIDVDGSDVMMMDYIKGLDYKPTFAYETPSNNKYTEDGRWKGYRFRLCYLMNEKVYPHEYKANYMRFSSGLGLKDNCMVNCVQNIGGTNKDCEVFIGGDTYSKVTINRDGLNPMRKSEASTNTKSVDLNPSTRFPSIKGITETLVTEAHENVFSFLQNHQCMSKPWTNFKHTEGKLVTPIPEDYCAIVSHSNWVLDGDGVRRSRLKKFGVGSHRQQRLADCILALRWITPTITTDELFYNAVKVWVMLFDNSDGKISIGYIMSKVNRVMGLGELYWNQKYLQKRVPKHKVNREFAKEQGYTDMRKAYFDGMRELKFQAIGEVYDFSISRNENIKALKGEFSAYMIRKFYKHNVAVGNAVACGCGRKKSWDDAKTEALKQILQSNKDISIRQAVVALAEVYGIATSKTTVMKKRKEILLSRNRDDLVLSNIVPIGKTPSEVSERLSRNWDDLIIEKKEEGAKSIRPDFGTLVSKAKQKLKKEKTNRIQTTMDSINENKILATAKDFENYFKKYPYQRQFPMEKNLYWCRLVYTFKEEDYIAFVQSNGLDLDPYTKKRVC